VVEFFSEAKGFRKTLEKINCARQQMGVERALLIGDRFSELEAQGVYESGD
jgi:argininosuccinate synthase